MTTNGNGNGVPMSTRFGTWQARLIARSVAKGLPRPRKGGGPREFEGAWLSWKVVPNSVSEHLEVTLHHEPCNEIGTTALGEIEKLAAFLTGGAGGARAMIVHSNVKRGFSAGADLRELHANLIAKYDDGGRGLRNKLAIATEVRGFIDRIHAAFDAIDTAPITTIAATHGFVFGGGFELALTCDVIVAEKSTRFAFPELRLGLVPGFGGIPRLKRDLGNAVVRDLLLTGRSVSAKRAHEVGLVSQVVARGSGLDVARKVAEQASRFDPQTTALAKRFTKPLPREELEREKDLFIEMMGSPVVEAALTKFVESDDVRPYLP